VSLRFDYKLTVSYPKGMIETTRLNVPLMFDVSSEVVRCDRNKALLPLTSDQHATNRRAIRVNNLWLVINFYLRHGKFIICRRAWWLHESRWRKQSLKPGILKPINTNIFESQADQIIKSRRRLCFHHSASVLQFLSNIRNFCYCHKYTKIRRFGISLLPSSGGDTVRVKMGEKIL